MHKTISSKSEEQNIRRLSLILLSLLSVQAFGFEELLGIQYGPQGLTFQVKSSGCTSKEDFSYVVFERSPMGLVLTRETLDLCEAHVPFGTKITFSYAELGFSPGAVFKVLNPLRTYIVPAQEKMKK